MTNFWGVSVSVSKNLVSEKKSRYWYRKNLSRIKSLGLGIGQNFGLVTQCNPPIQCQSIPNPCQSNVNLSPIRQANVNPGPIHQSNVNPSTIHVNPMSIYHRTANPMSILDQSNNSSASHHPSPIRQSITNPPIHHQSVAIQVSSHSNLIKQQFVANPANPANPVPIRYRSDHWSANLFSIQCQSDVNPKPIHANPVPVNPQSDPLPIRCQSSQSIANPVPIIHRSTPIHSNLISIQCQSDANLETIHGRSKLNQVSIHR